MAYIATERFVQSDNHNYAAALVRVRFAFSCSNSLCDNMVNISKMKAWRGIGRPPRMSSAMATPAAMRNNVHTTMADAMLGKARVERCQIL